MIRLIIAAIILVGISMALLSVRVIFKKGGRFRRGHACRFHQEQSISRVSQSNKNTNN